MAIPTIPQILTKADWDKEKGILAKIGVGETGVGAAMDKVKAAYAAVDWKKFDARLALSQTPKDTAPVDKALQAAKAEYASKVEKLRAELRNLQTLANKAAATFKAKVAIPKSSGEHALKIAQASDHMAVALKSMDAEFKTFEQMKQGIEQANAVAAKALLSYMGKIEGEIKKLAAAPDMAKYDAFHKELVRGLGAALARQKNLAALSAKWTVFSSDGYKPKKVEEIKPKLAELNRVLVNIKAALPS